MIVYVVSSNPAEYVPHPSMAGLWLASQGVPIHVLCPGEQPGEGPLETALGVVHAQRVGGRGPRLLAGFTTALAGLRRRHGRRALYYLQSHAVTPAAVALAGIPSRNIVYHTQDLLEPGLHPFWEKAERYVARRAGLVVANEPNRARFLASYYRLREMPLVVRTALPRAWPMTPRDPALRADLLGRVGRTDGVLVAVGGPFVEARASGTLVEALRRLDERYVPVFTGLRGEAERTTHAALDAAGIAGRSVCLPMVPHEQLQRIFGASDIGVMLYANDGFGNYYQAPGRLTEYLRAGIPILTSRFTGLELLVRTHDLGVACDPTSPDEVAAGLQALGEVGETERVARSERLRHLASAEFAYETDGARLLAAVRTRLASLADA